MKDKGYVMLEGCGIHRGGSLYHKPLLVTPSILQTVA